MDTTGLEGDLAEGANADVARLGDAAVGLAAIVEAQDPSTVGIELGGRPVEASNKRF